jgi:hypothetical protein
MAARRKRKTASASPKFLVVRGKGNEVLVGVAFPATTNAKLARAVDRARAGRGILKAKSAFILETEREVVALMGGIFGPGPPKGPGG